MNKDGSSPNAAYSTIYGTTYAESSSSSDDLAGHFAYWLTLHAFQAPDVIAYPILDNQELVDALYREERIAVFFASPPIKLRNLLLDLISSEKSPLLFHRLGK